MDDGDAPEVMSGSDLLLLISLAHAGLCGRTPVDELNEEVLARVRDTVSRIGLRGDDLIVAVR